MAPLSGSTAGAWNAASVTVGSPAIATVRAVEGRRVLDTMAPSTLGGIRFALLAVDAASGRGVRVQGLSATGRVLVSLPLGA